MVVLALVWSIKNRPEVIKKNEVKKEISGYKVELVVSGLEVPWSMAFSDSKRILVTERRGRIRVIENGKLLEKPLFVFSSVYTQEEAGLMGLTLDPEYKTNRLIYVCWAEKKDDKPKIKVERLVDQGETARADRVLVDNIIAAPFHDGCRLKFGPDKKLYVTTGEATQKDWAQKLDSLNGKILRLNSDGSIPADNPFTDSAVFSYGHRNPQGLDWDPRNGNLWETEHGPSGLDGPGGGDEINLIKAGGNYGWPLVSHEKTKVGTESPKLLFTPAIAPAGAMFYRGNLLPQFKNNFFFTALRGEGIYRAEITGDEPEKIAFFEKLSSIEVGRVREIIEGPEGAIYFSTSNRDGRGRPREGDDKIYRMVPIIK